MKENEKKAFDFAADTTKQLINLATAILTITVTLSNIISEEKEYYDNLFLFGAWGFYITSIFFGIWTLLSLTGTLQPLRKSEDSIEENENLEISINNSNIRTPSIFQIAFFLIALLLTVIYGLRVTNHQKKSINQKCKDCIEVIKESNYKVLNPSSIDTIRINK